MTNLLVLMIQIACFAFLAWGGMLSLHCFIQADDFEIMSRELKAA